MNEIERLITLLARLPGLGPRSARRAALQLIKRRESLLEPLAGAMEDAARTIRTCAVCGNLDTTDPCHICADVVRDAALVCVVEDVADLWALERTGAYRGRYHVLGGTLSAIDGVGPDELRIPALVDRAGADTVREVILATNLTVEGQTTAHYITEKLAPTGVAVTRLAHGVPVGGELDYLDDGTLTAALRARRHETRAVRLDDRPAGPLRRLDLQPVARRRQRGPLVFFAAARPGSGRQDRISRRLDEADAVILGGSYHSVHDDLAWQHATRDWLREYRSVGGPLLGICGGHQMIADIEGAPVDYVAGGEMAGTMPVRLTAAGRAHFLFAGYPSEPEFHFANEEHVTALPAGATILATRPELPCAALDHGGNWLSTQFHPEATAESLATSWRPTRPEFIKNYRPLKNGNLILKNFLEGTGVV
jgi:recombination protein RecR